MIKKADCIAALDSRDKRDYDCLCDDIDKQLNKYKREVIIVNYPSEISDSVIDRIVAEYSIHGGWKVNKKSDQRDGCWLTFE